MIVEEDFDGAPYESAAPFDSSTSTYFRVKASGNEKTFKIVDEDDNIIWSQAFLQEIFKYPEEYMTTEVYENDGSNSDSTESNRHDIQIP